MIHLVEAHILIQIRTPYMLLSVCWLAPGWLKLYLSAASSRDSHDPLDTLQYALIRDLAFCLSNVV
jgi:hypothetical protein